MELKAHLNKDEDFTFKKEAELPSCAFVAFISIVGHVPLTKMHIFRDVLEFLWNSCAKVCKTDFIFDNSIKEGKAGSELELVKKARFIPIHTLGRKLGHCTYSAVMKGHTLTGCDVTTKMETKTAAIKVSTGSYLHNFGKQNNLSAAEMFMV